MCCDCVIKAYRQSGVTRQKVACKIKNIDQFATFVSNTFDGIVLIVNVFCWNRD